MPLSGRAGDNFRDYTAKTSEIIRSLGLAAVAIAWLFSGGISDSDSPQAALESLRGSHSLYVALILAVVALTADLLQYASGAITWGALHWAIDQVDRNDVTPTPTRRGRLAWRILRATRTVQAVETTESSQVLLTGDRPDSFVKRRDRIRDVLCGRDKGRCALAPILDVVNGHVPTWLPLVTVVLWTLKLVAITAAYVSVLVYVWP